MIGAAALWLLAALPAGAICAGDCDGDGRVAVNELVMAVGIALGGQPLSACPTADVGGDGVIGIAELVVAVTGALQGCPADPTPTAPAPTVPAPSSATPTPTPLLTPAANQDPPTSGAPLRAWLEAGSYLGWAAESAAHPSSGPHFGTVRVFVNHRLLESLERGLASHPAGAATVKELYGRGSEVMGWSVMVKVEDDSDGGRGWYWYERFNTSQFADGRGVGGCSGCHAAGRDFIRIRFPLQ